MQRALVCFRIVLGVALLLLSAHSAILELQAPAHGGHQHPHVVILASVEAIGALLLLLPRTRQVGAVLLFLTIGVAFITHLLRREPRADLLVYMAGVILVAVHDRTTSGDAGAPPSGTAPS